MPTTAKSQPTRWPKGDPRGGQFAPKGTGGGAAGATAPIGLRLTAEERKAADAAYAKAIGYRVPEGKKLDADREAARKEFDRELRYHGERQVRHPSAWAKIEGSATPKEVAAHTSLLRAREQAKWAVERGPGEDREMLARLGQAYYEVAREHGYKGPNPLVAVGIAEHFESKGLGTLHQEQSDGWVGSSSGPAAMRLHAALERAGVRGSYLPRDKTVVRAPNEGALAEAGTATLLHHRAGTGEARFRFDDGRTVTLDYPRGFGWLTATQHLRLADQHVDDAVSGKGELDRSAHLALSNYHYQQYVAAHTRETETLQRHVVNVTRDDELDKLEARLAAVSAPPQPHPAVAAREAEARLDGYVREMYALHEASLRAAGISGTRTLYRGVEDDAPPKTGSTHQLAVRPASSWSTDEAAARKFADDNGGFVARAEVPVAQIYTSHHLFADASGEKEHVVLGMDSRPVQVVWSSGSRSKAEIDQDEEDLEASGLKYIGPY